MASGTKKAIVRLRNGKRLFGYLPASGLVEDGSIEMLGVDGKGTAIAINEIRAIAYVRDFNFGEPENPEGILRATFPGRPRSPGLWLKLTFRDSDEVMEGLAEINLGSLEALAQDGGLTLTPPDLRGNTQRLFVPNHVLASVEVLGWIAPPRKAAPQKPKRVSLTGDLFADEA